MVNKPNSKLHALLSKKEQAELKLLDDKSNSIRNATRTKEDLLNMSVKNVVNKWATANIDIMVDITNYLSTTNKYSNYFDDIDETGQWYSGIMRMISDFIKIFTQGDRPIYIGITFVLISFALYLIQITS